MATEMIQQQRTATPERWAKAFARAIEHGVTPKAAGADKWAVGASGGTLVYLVTANADGLGCTCKAGAEGDPICWHRAAVLAATTAPLPPATGAMALGGVDRCPDCDGLGYIRKISPTFGTPFRITCRACRGTKRAA